MSKTYVIIEAGDVSSVDFSQVLETSSNTLRYSNDNSKAFVKYEGSQPSFLNGKTTYTHAEMLIELAKEDWLMEEAEGTTRVGGSNDSINLNSE